MQRKYWLGLFLAAAALLFLFFSATLLFFYLSPSSPTASPFPQHHALRLLAFQHILLEPRRRRTASLFFEEWIGKR